MKKALLAMVVLVGCGGRMDGPCTETECCGTEICGGVCCEPGYLGCGYDRLTAGDVCVYGQDGG